MPEIESIKNEYNELLKQLADPGLISDWQRFEKLNARKKTLESIIGKEKEIKDLENKIEEDKVIVSAGEDKDLVSLAEAETTQLKARKKILEREMENLLSEKNSNPKNSRGQAVIIEIRAGAGGEEAALFATDLFKMYSKYGQSLGWKQKVLDSHSTELGGFKEIIFELSPARNAPATTSKMLAGAGRNGDVFSKMKYEAGVHRIQRIPTTEKSGRIHTSTASVAILPKPKKTDIKIKPDELKIDFFRSSGPGGQNVNKRETAVRITHLLSGIIVASQTERNQLQNKENALSILSARLLERKQEEELNKIGGARREQIGQAKRVEKIRTYNFPQNRVTDHRIKKSFHNIEGIMAGKLEPIINALSGN